MINSARDAPTLREQRIRRALTVAPAAPAIFVCAAIPAVRAAQNYTQSVATSAPPSSEPHTGELKFQESNNQICKLPQTVRFEIPSTIRQINE